MSLTIHCSSVWEQVWTSQGFQSRSHYSKITLSWRLEVVLQQIRSTPTRWRSSISKRTNGRRSRKWINVGQTLRCLWCRIGMSSFSTEYNTLTLASWAPQMQSNILTSVSLTKTASNTQNGWACLLKTKILWIQSQEGQLSLAQIQMKSLYSEAARKWISVWTFHSLLKALIQTRLGGLKRMSISSPYQKQLQLICYAMLNFVKRVILSFVLLEITYMQWIAASAICTFIVLRKNNGIIANLKI